MGAANIDPCWPSFSHAAALARCGCITLRCSANMKFVLQTWGLRIATSAMFLRCARSHVAEAARRHVGQVRDPPAIIKLLLFMCSGGLPIPSKVANSGHASERMHMIRASNFEGDDTRGAFLGSSGPRKGCGVYKRDVAEANANYAQQSVGERALVESLFGSGGAWERAVGTNWQGVERMKESRARD